MGSSPFAVWEAGKHPRKLFKPLVSFQPIDGCRVRVAPYDEVGVGEGRYLRKMCDAEHLPLARKILQLPPHRQSRRASRPCVDLIEGHDRRLSCSRREPEGKDETAQFTTGRDLGDGARLKAAIRGELQDDVVSALWARLAFGDLECDDGITEAKIEQMVDGPGGDTFPCEPTMTAQGFGRCGDIVSGIGQLLFDQLRLVEHTLQFLHPLPRGLTECQHRIQIVSVLPLQIGDECKPLLDLFELSRIMVEVGSQPADFCVEFGERLGKFGSAIGKFAQRSVDPRRSPQFPNGAFERSRSTQVTRRLSDGAKPLPQLFGVSEPTGSSSQLLFFSRLEACAHDLVPLESKHCKLAFESSSVAAERRGAVVDVDICQPGIRVSIEGFSAVGFHRGVKGPPHRPWFTEHRPIVLTHDVENAAQHLSQSRCRSQGTINRCARPPPINAPPEDPLTVLIHKSRLNSRFVPGRTDLILAGRLAAEQTQCAEQERLPGPGLTGNHHETWSRLEASERNQPKVLDRQLVKHGRGRIGAAQPEETDGYRASESARCESRARP